jgi:serine/threonine protein kinase
MLKSRSSQTKILHAMKIPGFDILEKLGEGGMATVWKAYQVSLDRVVAIKILKPQFAANPEEVRGFILEARSAAKIKHPNVVQVYDVAEIEGTYYFVMEYVAGSTVAKIIEKNGTIPQKTALRIAKCIAEALESTWDTSRLIHRDIKPENIMIGEDDTVKLADLGLAKMAGPHDASSGIHEDSVEGTPNYMSPEQAKFISKLDCRTDMYSLGASLYHMVTGAEPFYGHDPAATLNMHLTEHITNPRDINPDVTVSMAQFIAKLMMKNPGDRYPTWTEVLKDIKRVSAGHFRMIRKGGESESTVAPPIPRSTAPEKTTTEAPLLPSWVSVVALGVLLIWWALYLKGELKLPPPHQGEPSVTQRNAGSGVSSARSFSRPIPPAQALPQETIPATPEPVEQIASSNAPTAQSTVTRPATDNADRDNLDMLKMNVVNCLLAEDFVTAFSLVEKEKGQPYSEASVAQLDEIGKFIRDIARMPAIIEDAFRGKLGKEVVINFNRQSQKMIIRAIFSGSVNATLIGKSGAITDPITFSISKLPPAELNRWLGAADTPVKCAMKFILSMKAGDYESARTYASNCGPLTEFFTKEVESRLSGSHPQQ